MSEEDAEKLSGCLKQVQSAHVLVALVVGDERFEVSERFASFELEGGDPERIVKMGMVGVKIAIFGREADPGARRVDAERERWLAALLLAWSRGQITEEARSQILADSSGHTITSS